jgi:hypothetical protein
MGKGREITIVIEMIRKDDIEMMWGSEQENQRMKNRVQLKCLSSIDVTKCSINDIVHSQLRLVNEKINAYAL